MKYPTEAKCGLFMPTAAVICFGCHGPKAYDGRFHLTPETMKQYAIPRPPKNGEGVCLCVVCEEPMLCRDDVAWLGRLGKMFSELSVCTAMQQTGGMTAGLLIGVPGSRYDHDDDEGPDGPFLFASAIDEYTVGYYESRAGFMDGEWNEVFYSEDMPDHNVVALIALTKILEVANALAQ